MSLSTNITLRGKITLLALVCLLLGVGVFSFLGIKALNRSTDNMLQERLTTARLVADYVDEVLGRAINELSKVAETVRASEVESNLRDRVAALDRTYASLSIATDDIFLLDDRGRVVWSRSGNPAFWHIDLSADGGIGQVLADGGARVSGLMPAPVTSRPVIFLASPTRESYSGARGILVATIDVTESSIGGFIQPIKVGQTGYAEVVDQNGVVVARTEPGRRLSPFEKSDHPERFAALISAEKPTVGKCHTCHEAEQQVERKDVLAFVPLAKAPWGVAIRQSEDEALAPTHALFRQLLVSGLMLFGVFLLAIWLTTQDAVGRIGMLVSASRRMAGGDLNSSVAVKGRDEVGELARALDDMRTRLQRSYKEVEQRKNELASLLAVSRILTSPQDLPALLEATVAKAVEIIPAADGGAIILGGADNGFATVQALAGIEQKEVPLFPLSGPSAGGAGDGGCQVSAASPDGGVTGVAQGICAGFVQSDGVRGMVKGAICAPIVTRGQCTGALVVVCRRGEDHFTQADLSILQAVAGDIAMVVEKDRLAKEAEQVLALREADRLKSQFISSVSHELRTPLTSIKGYSTSLLRDDVDWDVQTRSEFLQIIDEKTDELRDLIDKLLQIARIESGGPKVAKEPVLMARVARKVVDEISPRARKHQLVLDFPAGFPVIEADARHMEQVLHNLVENAVKYSPDGGRVSVIGEVEDGFIRVCVEDEGIGIPPEHRDGIFERFYRVDNAVTRSSSGSGLGLSIVKELLEAHGGRIEVDGTVVKGSRLCFTLPVKVTGESQDDEEDADTGG